MAVLEGGAPQTFLVMPNCCTSGVLMPNSAAASNASTPPRSAARDWGDKAIYLTMNRTVIALAAGVVSATTTLAPLTSLTP